MSEIMLMVRYVLKLLTNSSDFLGPWAALEMGRITVQEFQDGISEVSSLAPEIICDLFGHFHNSLIDPLPEMIDAIKCIKSEGMLVGLLTNNWYKDKKETFLPIDQSLFDGVCIL